MLDVTLKKKLIKDIEEFLFDKHKVEDLNDKLESLEMYIEENDISKKSLKRYLTGESIPRNDKADILCISILELSGFQEYKYLKERNKGFVNQRTDEVPYELVSLPFIDSKHVIGRDEEIKDLTNILENRNKIVLVNGIGGVGKTTLAKYYLEEKKENYNYKAWIEVDKSIKDAFVKDTGLIDSLGLSSDVRHFKGDRNYVDKCFKLIINRMRLLKPIKEKPFNLLIIDNVDEEIEQLDILNYVALQPHWKIIVTSRDRLDDFVNYEVDTLSDDYALDLFYLHYQIEQNDFKVKEILKLIDNHTLGVEIISKTSQSLRLKLSEILKILKKKGLNISDKANIKIKHNYNLRFQNVQKYLLSVFDSSILTSYQKWILIQFIALPSLHIPYLSRDKHDLINYLSLKKQRKNRFTKELNEIVKKGWLKWDKKNDSFKLHQLIKDIIKLRLKVTFESCESLILNLNDRLKYQNLDYKAFIYASTLDNNVSGLLNLNYAEFLDNLSNVHLRFEKNKRSIALQKKALNIRINSDASKEELCHSYNGLSLSLLAIGHYKNALKYQLKDLELIYEDDYKFTYDLGITYNNLSLIYREIPNSINLAFTYQQKSIKIAEKIKDQDLDNMVYNNMGNLFYTQNRFKRALPYFEKSLRYRIKGKDELFKSQAYYNLGVVQIEVGKISQARENLIKSLNIEKNFSTHVGLCHVYIHLARCYFLEGNKELVIQNIDLFDQTYDKIDSKYSDRKKLKYLINHKNMILKNYKL
ncbi:NB-ARC domain-containing protein [Flavivirga abyssicola]|uniref:tetratricopeptide repeat protein n=1 Tax=Flavivirga abyssicola TaxID=3063533 RepID=UPI0026DFD326|nr:NB-ARC domain-containing protein [Flavivirga sp. MEBiC07777]WVK15145.1 NB-ARC domain-containing protein [Flavivirga sp. MEBiC07777]